MKSRSLQFPWETGPFPWTQQGRERQNLCGWAALSPSELWFPLYRVHATLFCSIFFPLIIYKPLFPFECRYSREHCCCSLGLWAFWTPPSPPRLTLCRTGGSCLSPESVPSFSLCPALLLCLRTARNPPAGPRGDREYVLNVLGIISRSKCLLSGVLISKCFGNLLGFSLTFAPQAHLYHGSQEVIIARPLLFLKHFSLASPYLWCYSCLFKRTIFKVLFPSTSPSKKPRCVSSSLLWNALSLFILFQQISTAVSLLTRPPPAIQPQALVPPRCLSLKMMWG